MSSSRPTAKRVLRLRVKDKHASWLSGLAALAKTRQAKSVLDAGWSAFRTMLLYKCADAGVWFAEVDEAFSTQTCSVCNNRTGPQGREGLGIRGWQCGVCGAIHDRDVNAAHNILAAGHRRLAEGILGP